MSRGGIDLLKIQTYVLKVHIHCQGCQRKVKKLLRKIEGVYSVNIDAEQQVVIVSGNVDSATLIKKLVSSGKHAELWSPSSYQKLNQGQANFGRDDKDTINGLEAFKTMRMFPSLHNDTQDHWSLNNYLNQNMGTKPLSGGIDQSQMAAAMVEDTYISDYEDRLAMEDHMRSMMAPTAFNSNGANFVGLQDNNFGGFEDFSARRPAYEYEHPPSMLMNNMQHRYYFNHPSSEMMHNGNSMMVDTGYRPQPHMLNYRSSLLSPYNDFVFGSAPYPYY